jgi:hypothetical protein
VRLKSRLVHGTQAVAEGGFLALVVVGLAAGAAFAGNGAGPDKSPTSTISLVVVGTAGVSTSATVQATYGGTVTFDIATTAAYPYVNLKCYQNGVLVSQSWAGFFDGALGNRTFRLYSPQWTGGAADCTANLDIKTNNKWKVLASTSFHVSA